MASRPVNLPHYQPSDEARRALGSEWLKNHPAALETLYDITRRAVELGYPVARRVLGPGISERIMVWSEALLKGYLFNCEMCGQCILHSTGMTCPMNCPKKMRNGPCGGVRPSGHCEVIPAMRCVWVQAWERGENMRRYADELRLIQPPVNRALRRTSAWVNLLQGRDGPPSGWMVQTCGNSTEAQGAEKTQVDASRTHSEQVR